MIYEWLVYRTGQSAYCTPNGIYMRWTHYLPCKLIHEHCVSWSNIFTCFYVISQWHGSSKQWILYVCLSAWNCVLKIDLGHHWDLPLGQLKSNHNNWFVLITDKFQFCCVTNKDWLLINPSAAQYDRFAVVIKNTHAISLTASQSTTLFRD